jgi:uncharacterized iron-regulated protein
MKDATMARSIANSRNAHQTVIHFNGSYHSDRHMGIIWYLNKYSPGFKLMTITTFLQDDIDKMNDESLGQADYVIVIPSAMTRTFK